MNSNPGNGSQLRKLAQDALQGNTEGLQEPITDVPSLLHELQVHQIELEMQNEDLRRVQHELEDTRNRYLDLYDFAPIGYFTLDKNGMILEINLTTAKKLGRGRSVLIKTPFSKYIAHDAQDPFYLYLRNSYQDPNPSDLRSAACESKWRPVRCPTGNHACA